ncbi:hypothetical protein NC00_01090 [Xanthomonas cannabis pv. phaseoli]|uniref:Uncharacterized protein n=1 Tax=Xanthomonas cannabis pv. phaseoli TaxID=1885902 RepID=A0AB34PD59_9XANT|nr:hypothetical protein [Xanthomonas cannabis]KGK59550.1 hypothetical protein NC00_01090 [Xanthomonas cannabis pv. phaseoli]
MIDVTSKMEAFRKAACHNWNNYLMPGENVLRLDVEQSFEIIERELLRCLVLGDMGEAADLYRSKIIECLAIRVDGNLSETQAYESAKNPDGNTHWNEVDLADLDTSYDFRFYDFFDWNHYGLINYELVRAIDIVSGKRFLIPTNICKFNLLKH